MKNILLIIFVLLSCLNIFSQDKIDYAKKTLSMDKALAASGMNAGAFFEKYKRIVSHSFTKDMTNINYVMLRDFLRGLQDIELTEDDIIVHSVSPKKSYNFIVFEMHAKNPKKDNQIDTRKIKMEYRVRLINENTIRTTVTLLHGWAAEFAIDKFKVASSMAIPKKESLTMRYEPDTDELFYDVEMALVTETDRDIVNKTFDDTFSKIEKISLEKLVPAINAILD